MDWFRSYHGAPSDTKLALIAMASGQHRAFVTAVWWELLDHASRNVTQCHADVTDRGDVSQIDYEIIAIQQQMDPKEVQAIVEAMKARGMICEGRIANWNKYQVRREDPQAAERKQKQRLRDKNAVPQGPEASRDVTQESRNVTTDKIRGDKKEKKEAVSPLADWVPVPEWDAFRRYRVKIRSPMTPEAETLNLSALSKLRDEGHDPKAVIEQSIAQGWKGLFPLKGGQATPNRGQREKKSNVQTL